jgi:hypothetical protein
LYPHKQLDFYSLLFLAGNFFLKPTKTLNMKVETSAINRYKIQSWINTKKNSIEYGVDVIIQGKAYHVNNGKKPLMFLDKQEAIKHVKKLNKELREEKLNQQL